MVAKKKNGTSSAKQKTSTTRAVASLEAVQQKIDALRAGGDKVRGLCGPAKKAKPLAPHVLAELTWPGGAPLPPSLVAWLGYDAQELDVMDKKARLRITTLREFVTAEVEEVAETLDEDDFDVTEMIACVLNGEYDADAPALRLPDSASQAHFLVFDGSVEPPVLGYEKEEFWVKFKSFGEFVASWF